MEAHGSEQSLPPHISPLGQDDEQSNPAKRKRTASPAKVSRLFLKCFTSSPFLKSHSYHVSDYITFILCDFL